ncbi:MAG: glycosyltransferase family protein [Rhodocyclaceae bacterium]|nr:glycosyltransferase family protein [Rhodocyclaceae bacterium]
MIGAAAFLTALAAALLAVPVLVLAVQVAAARPARPPGPPPGGRRPRLAVLVPAHDEAAGIAATLDSIQAQLAPGDRLLVVADNCTDATADLARARGAKVLERRSPWRRGKGYALDFGIRRLEAEPPEVVVIVDADCALAPGTLDALARCCAASGRPVQAVDLMHAPPGAPLKTRVAEFAWTVKNRVRPLGFHRLGLPCQLMGTGMAFPWPLIARAALASSHLTEDLLLGLDLARAGSPPLFCPEGLVSSRFPADAEGLWAQRTRWEHGHLGLIAGRAPRLLLEALGRRNGPLLALALDLAVPPLALLCLLVLALAAAAGLLLALGASPVPFALALGEAVLLAVSVFAAWWRFGRESIALGDLLAAAAYVLWKLPLYRRFLAGRQVEWVRSKREEP